jgi:hypothetical protein
MISISDTALKFRKVVLVLTRSHSNFKENNRGTSTSTKTASQKFKVVSKLEIMSSNGVGHKFLTNWFIENFLQTSF